MTRFTGNRGGQGKGITPWAWPHSAPRTSHARGKELAYHYRNASLAALYNDKPPAAERTKAERRGGKSPAKRQVIPHDKLEARSTAAQRKELKAFAARSKKPVKKMSSGQTGAGHWVTINGRHTFIPDKT